VKVESQVRIYFAVFVLRVWTMKPSHRAGVSIFALHLHRIALQGGFLSTGKWTQTSCALSRPAVTSRWVCNL